MTRLLRPLVLAVCLAMVATLAATVSSQSPAGAIEGGWNASNSGANLATVRVTTNGSTCSGTLVSPTLVLTARHCFRRDQPNPAPHNPRGNGFQDWEYASRFYSLGHIYPNGVNVLFGTDSDNPVRQIQASSYSVPGNIDVALLKLNQAVPSSVAVPARAVTNWTDNNAVSGFLANQTFSVFGFGKDGSGQFSNIMQEGRSNSAAFPCPINQNGWTLGDTHRICAAGSSGGVRSGDSGGPLYIDQNGTRYLVGVFQGLESARNGGRYVATFYRGGSGYNGGQRGNVAGWLEQHLASNGGASATVNPAGGNPGGDSGGGGTQPPQTAPPQTQPPQTQPPQTQPPQTQPQQGTCSIQNGTSGVTVSWSAISGAATYVYGLTVNGQATRFDRVNATSKFFPLASGTQVNVRVSAVYGNETYSPSAECGTVTVAGSGGSGGDSAPAPALSNGCTITRTNGGVNVTWAAHAGSDFYVYNVGARYYRTQGTQAFIAARSGEYIRVRAAGYNSNRYPGRYSPEAVCGATA